MPLPLFVPGGMCGTADIKTGSGAILDTGARKAAEVTGLEPAVSALTGQRVNHYTTPPNRG